jgi:hypothetical protein
MLFLDAIHLAHHAAAKLSHGFGAGNAHGHGRVEPALHFARVLPAQVRRLLPFPLAQADLAQSLARLDFHASQREARGMHGALRRAGVGRFEGHVVETLPDATRLFDSELAQATLGMTLDAAVPVVTGFGVANEIEHGERGWHGPPIIAVTAKGAQPPVVATGKVEYPWQRRVFRGQS